MVNPNQWSDRSSDDDSEEAPASPRGGVMWSRIPLSELVSTPVPPEVHAKHAERDDDDDDEEEDAETRSARRVRVAQTAESSDEATSESADEAGEPAAEAEPMTAEEYAQLEAAHTAIVRLKEQADDPDFRSPEAEVSAAEAKLQINDAYDRITAQFAAARKSVEQNVATEQTSDKPEATPEGIPARHDQFVDTGEDAQSVLAETSEGLEPFESSPSEHPAPLRIPTPETHIDQPEDDSPYSVPNMPVARSMPLEQEYATSQYDEAPTQPVSRTAEAPWAAGPEYVEARDSRLVPAFVTSIGITLFAQRRLRKQTEAKMKIMQERTEAVIADVRHEASRKEQSLQQQVAVQQEAAQAQQQVVASQERHITDLRHQQEYSPHQPMAQEQVQPTSSRFAAEAFAAPAAVPLMYAERHQAPAVSQAETSLHQPTHPERLPKPAQQSVEAPLPIKQQAEQAAAQAQAEQAQKEIAEQEHQARVYEVQDAWLRHRIQNGHEVDVVRGAAYHQERRQEIIPDNQADSNTSMAAGGGASTMGVPVSSDGLFTQAQQARAHPYPTLPSGMTTPSLPQGQHADSQHQLQAGDTKPEGIKGSMSNPWFWIMVLLIAAAFFIPSLI